MRSTLPDSPTSMRSQESFREEDDDDSGLQFVTQAPFSIGSPEHTNNSSRAIYQPLTAVYSSGEDIVAALFVPKTKVHSESVQIESQPLVDTDTTISTLPVDLSVSVPADEPLAHDQISNQNGHDRGFKGAEEDDEEDAEDDEEEDEIPQQEIIIHNTELSSPAVSVRTRHNQNVTEEGSEKSAALPPMPTALLNIMRVFRSESLNGRYLPRRLQRIPEAQQALIQTDDSWQPPLVGKPERPGTVPQVLLNALTERADRVTLDIEVGIAGSGDQVEHIEDECHEAEAEQTHGTSDKKQSPLSCDTSADSERSSVDWSPTPSPKRPQRALPPDTPVKMHDLSNISDQLDAEEEVAEDAFHGCLTRDRVAIRLPAHSQLQHTTTPSMLSQKSIVNKDAHNPRPLISDTVTEGGAQLNSSTQPPKQTNNPSAYKSVKVHRTPHLPDQIKSSLVPVQSSGSTTSIVPSTFDERSRTDVLRQQTTGKIFPEVIEYNDMVEFEVNSSEDEEREFESTPRPVLKDTSTMREHTSGRARSEDASSKGPAVTFSLQNRKRHNETTVNNPDELRRKRSRVVTQRDRSGHTVENTYSAVDDSRRHSRRKFYQELQQNRQSIGHVKASANRGSVRTGSTSSANPDIQMTSSKVSSFARVVDGVSSPDMPPSSHAAAGSGNGKLPPLRTTFDSFQAKNLASFGLFAEFKETYPDYGGRQHHFIAACQLLKLLREKSKATHPSLWDDFVFRHFHDYRNHLQEVMETCGNAMPYEVFYETCVEQPTHHKRIIRTAHLDMPLPPLNLIASQPITVEHRAADTSLPARPEIGFPEKVLSNKQEEQVIQESRIDDIVKSQESARSVHLWLERAAGAESPELGTPEVNGKHSNEVPPLNLRRLETTSPSQSRVVIVPRPLLRESSGSSRSKLRLNEKSDKRVLEPMIQTPRNVGSAPTPTSIHLSKLRKAAAPSLANSPPKVLSPFPEQTTAKEQAPTSDKVQTALPASQLASSTKSKPVKASAVEASSRPFQEVDTVFSRFMRDYNNLACERGVQIDDPNIQYADFSWITNDYSGMKHSHRKSTS